MARPVRPASADQAAHARRGLEFLRLARLELQKAGASQALKRVRSAIASADGAVRHTESRVAMATAQREN